MDIKEANKVAVDATQGIAAMFELVKKQAEEIEGLNQRIHYLREQRDDLNDDLIETVDAVLKNRFCVKILKETLGRLRGA